MTNALRFVPPRVQLVDPRTGMISREWYLFLQGVFDRIGGADSASIPDLTASLFEDAGSSETNAMLFSVEQAFGQNPADVGLLGSETLLTLPPREDNPIIDALLAELSGLRDQVAELVKEIESIKQGTLI